MTVVNCDAKLTIVNLDAKLTIDNLDAKLTFFVIVSRKRNSASPSPGKIEKAFWIHSVTSVC